MKLYLYKTGTGVPELTIENAASYTDREVVTAGGEVLGPLAEDMEHTKNYNFLKMYVIFFA